MREDVLSFSNIQINNDLLMEIWKFDPRQLEHIDGLKISIYALALSQYLVYFAYQRNLSQAEQHKLKKYIDRTVSLIMASDDSIKKLKTKASLVDYIISTNESLIEAQSKLEEIQQELLYIEGMDKAISELIATLKRELTRRENELYQVRRERKNI